MVSGLSSMPNRNRLHRPGRLLLALLLASLLAGCAGRGFSLPSLGLSKHRSSSPPPSSRNTPEMELRSVVILANAVQVWRQIEADAAAQHVAWIFRFEARCNREQDARQLLQAMPASFTTKRMELAATPHWIVSARSSQQQLEMSQARLKTWVDSASALSRQHDCELSAWDIIDVTQRKGYRSVSRPGAEH